VAAPGTTTPAIVGLRIATTTVRVIATIMSAFAFLAQAIFSLEPVI